ncbi:hypothetical protein M3Y96_01050900 [Aphelenchoides besseyi]|nr:hypothetical protein M3Y96_01050900 [Aphelenchoides besseyi]
MRVNLFVFVRLVSATVIIAAPIDWFSGNGAESLVDYSDIEEQTDDEEPFDISISPSELKALDMFLKIWNEESKEYARQHVPSIDFLTEDNEKKEKDDAFKKTFYKHPPAHWTYPDALGDLD